MASTVIESWKLITAIDNYEEVAGKILFTRIFTIAPEAYALFSFAEDNEMFSEGMYESPKFKKHAAGVIRTVNVAVGMLGPDLSELADILKKLGKRHKGYKVVEAHYPVVGQALIETLDAAMGEKFTEDVKAAWLEIWGIISSTMIAGAEY
eukprot:scaffold3111_cov263-Chaetoceros_neogracile.AAC.12